MTAQINEKLNKLFNSAYFISKENLAFAKFPELCKLQMKNGGCGHTTELNHDLAT